MRQAKRSRSAWANRQQSHESVSHKLHKPREYNHRAGLAIGLIILIGLGLPFSVWIFGYSPYFHNYQKNSSHTIDDPIKPLWFDCIPANSGWTIQQTTFSSATCGTNNLGGSWNLASTASIPAIALSQTPIDLSQASSKVLEWDMIFAVASPGNVPEIDFFLTKNSTMSTFTNYDPYSDPSTVLLIKIDSSSTVTIFTFIQKDVTGTKTIASGDFGCPNSGTTFNCVNYGNTMPTNQLNQISLQLNFTGQTGTLSDSNIQFERCPTVPCTLLTSDTIRTLPQLTLTGTYYLGLWTKPTSGTANVQVYGSFQPPNPASNGINFQNSMVLAIFTPNPPTVQPSPFIDTGGFFGPIIKALISLGVFIAQNIINFLTFLASIFSPLVAGIIALFSAVFVAVFNALGSIFGDSSLGTQIGTFLSNISTYLSQVFSGAMTFLDSGVTFLVNGLSIITAFFTGGNNFIGLWLAFLNALASIIPLLGGLLAFFNMVGFTINLVVIVAISLLTFSAIMDWSESDNPFAGFIAIFLGFLLFYVLAFGSSGISPVATNTTVQANYQTAWNNVKFFLQLMPVLFISMIVEWAAGVDEVRRFHNSTGFMPHFQSLLKFYIMLTVDTFKAGYWFFSNAYDIITKGITAIKGRWSPVEVAGTG